MLDKSEEEQKDEIHEFEDAEQEEIDEEKDSEMIICNDFIYAVVTH